MKLDLYNQLISLMITLQKFHLQEHHHLFLIIIIKEEFQTTQVKANNSLLKLSK